MVTDDARCACEIKSRMVMAKTAFDKKALFISKLGFNFRKTLVNCYILSSELYGAENYTLRKLRRSEVPGKF
jgi:hypothetical protein